MRPFFLRLFNTFRHGALDRQLDEELRFHLEMETETNRNRGMNAQEAAMAARRAFGGEQHVKETYRDRRGLPMLDVLFKDLQYGLRMIRRSRGFTAIAVLSLALGIGANTAIFTLIDAVMLRSLPVQSPNDLVSIGDVSRPGGVSNSGPRLDIFSYPLYERLRDQNRVFSGLFASGRTGRLIVEADGGGEEPARGRLVSGNFFDVLGVRPSRGRMFTADEDRKPGASPVVVIGYDYWENRFGSDPAITGRTLKLNGLVFTVIGVGPRRFTGEVVGAPADLWIPLSMQARVNPGDSRLDKANASWLLLMGRLKPGVPIGQARADVNALATQAVIDFTGAALSADRMADIGGQEVEVQPGAGGFSSLRSRFSRPLLILMIVVGLVLLIACGNVANLLLARATSRRKEICVRLAMGASRRRLVRQLLTETFLLAAIGGTAGLLLAWAGSGLLLRFASGGPNPIPLDVHPNGAMLGFTAGVSLLTGILFGLAPALCTTRVDLAPALKASARSLTSGGGRQLGRLLVIAQVALSLLLLVVGGLFIRSLVNLETFDVGYSRTNLAVLRTDPAGSGYSRAQQLPLARRLMERLRAIPGVIGVTVSENGLFGTNDSSSGTLRIEGFSPAGKEDSTSSADQVGPHYFQVLGVPLLAGRDFDERDRAGAPRVAILNETMSRFYFGKRDPIGKSILDDNDRYTVIGVAKDMKERRLKGETERRFFLPFFQITDRITGFNFEIKTRIDEAQVLPAIRREMQLFDPNLKGISLDPVHVLIDRSIPDERLIAQLSGFFAVLALLLATAGLYGVMAYAMSRRADEIGLRMALGASRGHVIRMVLRETLTLVAAGIAIGLPAALAATRLIAAALFGLSPGDPATLAGATALMLLVAVLAAWVPARHASRVSPMSALRQE